jgi:hypothetical protein
MLVVNRSRVLGSLALVGIFGGAVAPARADSAPAAASPPVVISQPASAWRRYAVPLALTGAALGLVGGVGFKVVSNHRTDEFNAHNDRGCRAGAPDAGGPGCADLLEGSESASRWANVGFAAAGAFAITALVLKLTEPDAVTATTAQASAAPRLACAPGLWLSGSCRLTF